MGYRDKLNAIFDAERALRAAEADLLSHRDQSLVKALAEAVDEAIAHEDAAEASLRLYRLADLCAQLPGPEMADALVRILSSEDAAVRNEAGEALLDVAYDRYAEVARAVERALDATLDGPAMIELPFLISEVGEPSAVPLLRRFAAHPNPDVVAAAIEAFAELGDPAAAPTLEALAGDERVVSLDDDTGEGITSTLGELAEEALEALSGAPREE
jgi:HEAT repeat protein